MCTGYLRRSRTTEEVVKEFNYGQENNSSLLFVSIFARFSESLKKPCLTFLRAIWQKHTKLAVEDSEAKLIGSRLIIDIIPSIQK